MAPDWITDIGITVLGFIVFAVLHSILANPLIKKKVFDRWPHLQSFYRIGYSLIALAILATWYIFSPFPDGMLYNVPSPFHFLFRAVQGLGVAGFILSLKAINLSKFMGLDQFKNDDPGKTQSQEHLVTDGLYKWVRHPLYTSTIMILLFNPVMTNKLALITLLIILYSWIGSVFEERNLTALYGPQYVQYQKHIPRFIPKIPLF